ncbi:MAG: hypothetical protein Q4P66_04095 [Actinomycetaceae bacterium]|nr:hypothetical protein [Actinomycetaceae bacterium]
MSVLDMHCHTRRNIVGYRYADASKSEETVWGYGGAPQKEADKKML